MIFISHHSPLLHIEKDSVRTDRSLEFFSDANIHNVFTLERVMKTYVLLRPDIGIHVCMYLTVCAFAS